MKISKVIIGSILCIIACAAILVLSGLFFLDCIGVILYIIGVILIIAGEKGCYAASRKSIFKIAVMLNIISLIAAAIFLIYGILNLLINYGVLMLDLEYMGYYLGMSSSIIACAFPLPSAVITLPVALICHYIQTESNQNFAKKTTGGIKMIIFGWILTIAGGIGTIISQIIYSEAKEDYGNRFYSYYSSSRSEMEIAQIATYICIGVTVLGIILLIVGYINKTNAANRAAQNEILKHLSQNSVNQQTTQIAADKIICPNCNYKNNSDAKFCNSCGSKLSTTSICNNCGIENESAARFCKKCGNQLH